jgi:hypothetical protein
MPKVRVAEFGVSLNGFSAGTEQSLNDPPGKRSPELQVALRGLCWIPKPKHWHD